MAWVQTDLHSTGRTYIYSAYQPHRTYGDARKVKQPATEIMRYGSDGQEVKFEGEQGQGMRCKRQRREDDGEGSIRVRSAPVSMSIKLTQRLQQAFATSWAMESYPSEVRGIDRNGTYRPCDAPEDIIESPKKSLDA